MAITTAKAAMAMNAMELREQMRVLRKKRELGATLLASESVRETMADEFPDLQAGHHICNLYEDMLGVVVELMEAFIAGEDVSARVASLRDRLEQPAGVA